MGLSACGTIGDIAAFRQLQASFRTVAQKTIPVVVSIRVLTTVTQETPWEFYFGDPEAPEQERGEKDFERLGIGSGVIVERKGDVYFILTNYHVITDASEIRVMLNNRKELTAELVGVDERKDLALIKCTSGEPLPVAVIGNSDQLQVGDIVFAVGNPFGWESTVTSGIVSALGRRLESDSVIRNINDFIQTDAGINPGNSGGALINLDGEVVGINTWITSPTGGSIGIGFAIPINNAKKAILDFIQTGRVQYGWLGISIAGLYSDQLALELGLQNVPGAFINFVYRDSPAARNGLLPGDLVVRINEIAITDDRHLTLIVSDLRAGVPVQFQVLRLGKPVTLTVIPDLRPTDASIVGLAGKAWPGFICIPLTPETRARYGYTQDLAGMLVVSVDKETAAALAGFKVGDVVKAVNQQPVKNAMDFFSLLNDKKEKRLEISCQRQDKELQFTMER